MLEMILYPDMDHILLKNGYLLKISTIIRYGNFLGLELQNEFEAYENASWDEEYAWLSHPSNFI